MELSFPRRRRKRENIRRVRREEIQRVRVSVARGGMPTKGERGKATDFSIAAIMAPRGPSFAHYHLQGNAAATTNTNLECPTSKGFVSTLDHCKSFLRIVMSDDYFNNVSILVWMYDFPRSKITVI